MVILCRKKRQLGERKTIWKLKHVGTIMTQNEKLEERKGGVDRYKTQCAKKKQI